MVSPSAKPCKLLHHSPSNACSSRDTTENGQSGGALKARQQAGAAVGAASTLVMRRHTALTPEAFAG